MDINEIKKQVKDVISYSQGFDANVDELIDNWYVAKKDFLELFDGNTYIRSNEQVVAHVSKKERDEQLSLLYDRMLSFHAPRAMIDFIDQNAESFYDNIVTTPYQYLDITIPAGIKITKAFKYFIEDKNLLDYYQTEASKIIQNGKITGYLYLSVHPLDYLSSSENTYNWRSCHALDGEYRAGNLSYMLDSSTVICYIANDELVKLPHFPSSVPWNSKKWRMLLFTSDNNDALFAGRNYPFFSKELMNEVLKMYEEITRFKCTDRFVRVFCADNVPLWTKWHHKTYKDVVFSEGDEDNYSLDETYYPIGGSLYKSHDLITDVDDLHFNDLLYSTVYKPYYSWNRYLVRSNIHFHIGHSVRCLSCGNEYLYEHDSMTCEYCSDNFERCYSCDTRLPRGDLIYVESEDQYVCGECFDRCYGYCSECGEAYHIDNLIWDEDREEYFCEYCYNKIHSED